jgi:hypothetical protein
MSVADRSTYGAHIEQMHHNSGLSLDVSAGSQPIPESQPALGIRVSAMVG